MAVWRRQAADRSLSLKPSPSWNECATPRPATVCTWRTLFGRCRWRCSIPEGTPISAGRGVGFRRRDWRRSVWRCGGCARETPRVDRLAVVSGTFVPVIGPRADRPTSAGGSLHLRADDGTFAGGRVVAAGSSAWGARSGSAWMMAVVRGDRAVRADRLANRILEGFAGLFARCLRSTRRNHVAHFLYGRELLQAGDEAAAFSHFDACRHSMQLDLTGAQAWIVFAVVDTRRGGGVDRAEECYRAAVRQSPNLSAAHRALGDLLVDTNRVGGDRSAGAAVRTDPESFVARHSLGYATCGAVTSSGATAELERRSSSIRSLSPRRACWSGFGKREDGEGRDTRGGNLTISATGVAVDRARGGKTGRPGGWR